MSNTDNDSGSPGIEAPPADPIEAEADRDLIGYVDRSGKDLGIEIR